MQNEMPEKIYVSEGKFGLQAYRNDVLMGTAHKRTEYMRADLVTVPPDDAARALDPFNMLMELGRRTTDGINRGALFESTVKRFFLADIDAKTIRRALQSQAENERLRKALEEIKKNQAEPYPSQKTTAWKIAYAALSHAENSDGGE